MSAAPGSSPPTGWTPRCVRLGDWTITALSDGTMRLDGGSMWGVVPKTLWSRMTPAAEDNTILLALRPFLVERGDLRVVIEPGIGDRWEEKWLSIYHIDRTVTLESSLAALGLSPDDVTHVIASHCHFDHVGGQVVRRGAGLAPLFPRARHFAPAIEVEVAKRPDSVRAASYRAEDVVPIEEAGLLETYSGSAELAPGIRVHDASGHSDGVSVVTIGEDEPGPTAIFWADVVPTGHHVQPPYIMAYDIDQTRSYESRSLWLARAAEERWLGLFYHDAERPFGRVHREGRRYRFEEVAGEVRAAAGTTPSA